MKVQAAKPGDEVGLGGPRGSFVVPTGFDWHLLIGDETALPAIARRLEELPDTAQAITVIETGDAGDRRSFTTRARLQTHWIETGLPDALARQAASPVRWAETIQKMAAEGVVSPFDIAELSILGWLMVLAVVAFFASTAFKVIPHYLDYMSLEKIITSVETDKALEVRTVGEFYSHVE